MPEPSITSSLSFSSQEGVPAPEMTVVGESSNGQSGVRGDTPASVDRYYGVESAGCRILIPAGIYCEIIPNPKYSSIPNAPSRLLGVMNVRGNLVPLYQLHELVGEALPEQYDYALMIGKGNVGAIVVAGKPTTILKSRTQALSPDEELSPPDCLAPCILKGVMYAGRTWFVINHDELFRRLSSPGMASLDVL